MKDLVCMMDMQGSLNGKETMMIPKHQGLFRYKWMIQKSIESKTWGEYKMGKFPTPKGKISIVL